MKHATKRRTVKPKVPPPQLPDHERNPRDWSPELRAQWLERLCIWITEGGSLSSFTRNYPQGPQKAAWFKWFEEDATFAERYARARENGADTLAEETIAIADEVQDAGQFDSARVNAARLRVDARKWVASKLKPKTYADRVETVTSGALTVTHTLTDDDRAKALATLFAREAIKAAGSLPEAQRLIEAQAIDVTPEKTSGPEQTGP
jgi:hypothetical protein